MRKTMLVLLSVLAACTSSPSGEVVTLTSGDGNAQALSGHQLTIVDGVEQIIEHDPELGTAVVTRADDGSVTIRAPRWVVEISAPALTVTWELKTVATAFPDGADMAQRLVFKTTDQSESAPATFHALSCKGRTLFSNDVFIDFGHYKIVDAAADGAELDFSDCESGIDFTNPNLLLAIVSQPIPVYDFFGLGSFGSDYDYSIVANAIVPN